MAHLDEGQQVEGGFMSHDTFGVGDPYESLRLADVAALNAYVAKRQLTVSGAGTAASAPFGGAAVLYHAWKPGFLELSESSLAALRELRGGRRPGPMTSEQHQLQACLEDLRWLDCSGPDLDQLVERTKDVFIALQNPVELRKFLGMVEQLRPRVVVEIGTAAGGVLYCLAQLAHPDALIVRIDFPGGPYGGGQLDVEADLFRSFAGPRQEMAFIRDRSFHLSSRADLQRLLAGRPIDLLFIDGDHSYGGVLADFEMYGSLVRAGGMTAFHDIILEPELWGRGADAGVAWKSIRERHRCEEIFDPGGRREPPARRPQTYDEMAAHAWGIGVIHN
jgi:predicted O-methyltransferase YrrM